MTYGENGKEYFIGETSLKIDDEFVIATVLAVVGVLQTIIPNFDELASATASRIYDEIKKDNINT